MEMYRFEVFVAYLAFVSDILANFKGICLLIVYTCYMNK